MSRLKIIYIASLILLGLMVSLTVFKPLVKGAHYNDVQQESLIKNDQEWVLQFSLINNDTGAETYQVNVDKDGQLYQDEVTVAGQGEYTYIQHFQQQPGKDTPWMRPSTPRAATSLSRGFTTTCSES